MTVYCDCETCKYNEEGLCYKITITLNETGKCADRNDRIEEDENDR